MRQIGGGKENKAQALRSRNQKRNMVGMVDCKYNLRAEVLILPWERSRRHGRLHLRLVQQKINPDQK